MTNQPSPPTRPIRPLKASNPLAGKPAPIVKLHEPNRAPAEGSPATIIPGVYEKVQQILTNQETICQAAIQIALFNFTPDCIVLTNRRFIIYRPKLLGRADFEDYIWRDLRDIRLEEGIFSANLTMQTVAEQEIRIDYLPKHRARRVYAFAQEMEERVREERRWRDLETKRAAAGGVVLNGISSSEPNGSRQPEDPVQRLRHLKAMFEADLITAGEFEAKRAQIISGM